MCEINKRHKAAELMQQNNQCQVSTVRTDKEWTIQSQSQQNIYYTINLQNNHCDCKIVCSSCGVCTHHFTCTCLDSTLRSTVCKHIHFLMMAEVCKTYCIISMRQPTVEFCNIDVYQYVRNKGQNRKEYELIHLKDSIYALTSELQLLTKECSNKSIMNTLKHRLHAAVSVVKVLLSKINNTEVSLTPMIQYAPNSNHEKQLTFRSTRKKGNLQLIRSQNLPKHKYWNREKAKRGGTNILWCLFSRK